MCNTCRIVCKTECNRHTYMLCTLCTDIEVLHLREDWRVQAEEGSVITSLVRESCPTVVLSPSLNACSLVFLICLQPVLFESIVVELLLTLREIVIEIHPGETEVCMYVCVCMCVCVL